MIDWGFEELGSCTKIWHVLIEQQPTNNSILTEITKMRIFIGRGSSISARVTLAFMTNMNS